MSEKYPLFLGGCNLHNEDINETLKSQIVAAFQLLSDDSPSPTKSVDNPADSEFIRASNAVMLRDHRGRTTRIANVSVLPFRDVVLTPIGNKKLTDEAVIYIKKFTSFVKRTNIAFENGRFSCPRTISKTSGSLCSITADRPCPLYYSATQPALRATNVESLGIPGRDDGRVLVHLDPDSEPIPDTYKREVVYAGTRSSGFVTCTRNSFIALEYALRGAVYHLCWWVQLESESAVEEVRIQVVMCEREDGYPRLDIYKCFGLSDEFIFCDWNAQSLSFKLEK